MSLAVHETSEWLNELGQLQMQSPYLLVLKAISKLRFFKRNSTSVYGLVTCHHIADMADHHSPHSPKSVQPFNLLHCFVGGGLSIFQVFILGEITPHYVS